MIRLLPQLPLPRVGEVVVQHVASNKTVPLLSPPKKSHQQFAMKKNLVGCKLYRG